MDRNRISQSVIVGLAAVVATANWIGLKNFLFEGGSVIFPVVGFLALLVFLSLNCLLTRSKIILLITLVFVLISFLFSFGVNLNYLAVLLIALLLFVFGFSRSINEKQNRVKIQVSKILHKGLPLVLTGLSLVIATVYYFSPLALQGQDEIKIPRPLFDAVLQPAMDIIGEQSPVSQLGQPVDVSLIMNEEISDMLFEKINQDINRYSGNYKQYFPLGLSIGAFFAIKAISIPFMWIIILLSWAIFKLLVALGAVRICEKAVLQEMIEV